MLVEPAAREYRTWSLDSRRWQHYRPRRDDIVIATYPKCGTTWMQRIVSLLVFRTTEAKPIMEISAWLDQRFASPIEPIIARIEAQDHRRFIKAHLPLDGLPFYNEVKYVHVARDGRDAAMSFYNHAAGLSDGALQKLDSAGLADERVGRPYPPVLADPAEFFHRWITEGAIEGHEDGQPHPSFFRFERTWWEARSRENILLVHYNDLKADLLGEMRRIAQFLDIEVLPDQLRELAATADFAAMRRDGDALMASVASTFREGSRSFIHKGTNGRWRGVVRGDDLALYAAKAEAMLPPECIGWLEEGRRGGDPRSM